MNDIVEMLAVDHAVVVERGQQNRERFPAGGALKDLFAAQGMGGSIVYAENTAGEVIGKRDPGPWIDGGLIVRAAEWNARVYGIDTNASQRDRIKRLREVAA